MPTLSNLTTPLSCSFLLITRNQQGVGETRLPSCEETEHACKQSEHDFLVSGQSWQLSRSPLDFVFLNLVVKQPAINLQSVRSI